MHLFITGGSGFIGTNLVRYILEHTTHSVINLDKLSYCNNKLSLKDLEENPRYTFYQGDINNKVLLNEILNIHSPDAVLHLAAESHVDKSIDTPLPFIESNILGTYNLLEVFTQYWNSLELIKKENFKFIHISTDEVYGSLGVDGSFTEETPYAPSSPYSASKASSDHLVNAWHATYGLPTIISNCSNNFGPYQFPEKLIPVIILNALKEKTIPIYGNGSNVRNWLFVEDHARALLCILEGGIPGESYNIGSDTEITNLEIAQEICKALDKQSPSENLQSYSELINFVNDRPGHDFRYSVDYTKINKTLGWKPQNSFNTYLNKTIDWYLNNSNWTQEALNQHDVTARQGRQ